MDDKPTALTEEMVSMLEYFWHEKGDVERWVDYEENKHLFPGVVRAIEEIRRAHDRVDFEIARLSELIQSEDE